MITIAFLVIAIFPNLPWVHAWDNDQLEVFDVVEEVNQNFYELLGVAENAETGDIKKAYRKLSLQLHPDRNPAADAELRFRQLVSVYEILKNEDRRKLYDSVLRDGLPDWRQPVYYYRKARKLGLAELFVILFVIFTVGHYLVIWAMYLERKFELEEILFSQMKRKHEKETKRRRDKADLDKVAEGVSEMVTDMLEAPTWYRLLPVQLGFALKEFAMNTPRHLQSLQELARDCVAAWRERVKEKEESEEEEEENEEETKKRPKRKRIALPEYSGPEGGSESAEPRPRLAQPAANGEADRLPARAKRPWTEAELSKLAKAMARFPSGTLNRWEKVAEFMERTVGEITAKNKELREAGYNHVDHAVSAESPEERVKKNKKSAQAMAALTSDPTMRDAQRRPRRRPNRQRRRGRRRRRRRRRQLVSKPTEDPGMGAGAIPEGDAGTVGQNR